MSIVSQKTAKPVGIFSFTGTDNYGGCLQNYALSTQIERLGYPCEQIFLFGSRKKNSPFHAFRKRYFHLTEPVSSFSQCLQLNDRYDTIVTGSDVVWQERCLPPELGMLAWASGDKTLLSYAASFGEAVYNGNTSPDMIAAMLSRFDAISVREDTGTEICTSLGLEARHVLDPSLLLDAREYEGLIGDFDGDLTVPDDYVFFYDAYSCPPEQIRQLTEKFASRGQTLVTGECFGRSVLTPEQWLNFIRNARYVITHSFHGLCFSLIFKKNFIQLNQSINTARYASLYKLFGITKTGHDLASLEPTSIEHEPPIDFGEVDKRLAALRQGSLSFLKESLAIPPTYKPPFWESVLSHAHILRYTPANEAYIDETALNSWVDAHPFAANMKYQDRDLLKFCIDLKMEKMFYAYETRDPKVLNERAVARGLLLGDARRVLGAEACAEARKDPQYELDPHKFQWFINSTRLGCHRDAVKKRIQELGDARAYILFSTANAEKIYSFAKNSLQALRPQAYLHFGPPPSADTGVPELGVPVRPLLPFIETAEPLPIIALGSHTFYLLPLLDALGLKNEIIPCAFG